MPQLEFFTCLDRLGNKGVVGGFVAVLQAGDDLAGETEIAGMTKHDQADHLALVVGPYHVLAENIAGELLLYGLEILAVMPEFPPLPDGGFVENGRQATHKFVIILGLLDRNALFFGFPDEAANAGFDLVVPPMVVGCDGQRRDFLPF